MFACQVGLRAHASFADKNLMDRPRLRIATTSGLLTLFFSSALVATGAPAGVLALATIAGILVIWRYTGALELVRSDWAEARELERRLREEHDRDTRRRSDDE
jgi:hypothetical protein